MKTARDVFLRLILFLCVFLIWLWVGRQQFSETTNLSVIVGAVVLVFPVAWLGRILLDRDPTPPSAEWLTTLIHALVMILFGSAIVRALATYESWRGWTIPIPRALGLVLAVITGAAALLSVLNLALRGLGAPFAIALSRRLASDWMYSWTRNPMVVGTLAFLVSLALWMQSALFLVWACFLVSPALLFFVRVFEERELAIRFGDAYLAYKARTPMLIPHRPAPVKQPKGSKSRRSRNPKRTVRQRTSRNWRTTQDQNLLTGPANSSGLSETQKRPAACRDPGGNPGGPDGCRGLANGLVGAGRTAS